MKEATISLPSRLTVLAHLPVQSSFLVRSKTLTYSYPLPLGRDILPSDLSRSYPLCLYLESCLPPSGNSSARGKRLDIPWSSGMLAYR